MQLLSDYRQQIEAALKYCGGSHTFDDVQSGVARGDQQAWPGLNSIIITEIHQAPQQRILHFFLAGGNSVELEAMLPLIEEWGRGEGCTHATLFGRKGWTRSFLPKHDWKETLVVMEKEL